MKPSLATWREAEIWYTRVRGGTSQGSHQFTIRHQCIASRDRSSSRTAILFPMFHPLGFHPQRRSSPWGFIPPGFIATAFIKGTPCKSESATN
jgi:hypothetical protein